MLGALTKPRSIFACDHFLSGRVYNRDIFDKELGWKYVHLKKVDKGNPNIREVIAYMEQVEESHRIDRHEAPARKKRQLEQAWELLSQENRDYAVNENGILPGVAAFMGDAMIQAKTADVLLHLCRGGQRDRSWEPTQCFKRSKVSSVIEFHLKALSDLKSLLTKARDSIVDEMEDQQSESGDQAVITEKMDMGRRVLVLVQSWNRAEQSSHVLAIRKAFVCMAIWFALARSGVVATPDTVLKEIESLNESLGSSVKLDLNTGRSFTSIVQLFLYSPLTALFSQSPGTKPVSYCARVQLNASLVPGMPPALDTCVELLQRVPLDIIDGKDPLQCILNALEECLNTVNAEDVDLDALNSYYTLGTRAKPVNSGTALPSDDCEGAPGELFNDLPPPPPPLPSRNKSTTPSGEDPEAGTNGESMEYPKGDEGTEFDDPSQQSLQVDPANKAAPNGKERYGLRKASGGNAKKQSSEEDHPPEEPNKRVKRPGDPLSISTHIKRARRDAELQQYRAGESLSVSFNNVKKWREPVDERIKEEGWEGSADVMDVGMEVDMKEVRGRTKHACALRGGTKPEPDVQKMVPITAFMPSGDPVKVNLRALNPDDFALYEQIRDHIIRCSISDGIAEGEPRPPHWIQRDLRVKPLEYNDLADEESLKTRGSIFYPLTREEYLDAPKEELRRLLKEDKILVIEGGRRFIRDVCQTEPGFGLLQLASVGGLDKPRNMQDIGARQKESTDGDEYLRTGSLRELLRISRNTEDGPAVNALDIPCSDGITRVPPRFLDIADDYRSWCASAEHPYFKSKRPIQRMEWRTVGTESASTELHIDADGFLTWSIVNGNEEGTHSEVGGKLWVAYRDACDVRIGWADGWKDYDPEQLETLNGFWEAIVLKPGTLIIQGPCVRCCDFGLSNNVVVGGHFLCFSVIEKSIHAYLQCHFHGKTLANQEHHIAVVQAFQRMLYCIKSHWYDDEDLIDTGLTITDWEDVRAVLSLIHVHQLQIVLEDILSGIDSSLPFHERKMLLEEWSYGVELGSILRLTLEHKLDLEEHVETRPSGDMEWIPFDWKKYFVYDLANQFAAVNAYATLNAEEIDKHDRWASMLDRSRDYLKMLDPQTDETVLECFNVMLQGYEDGGVETVHFTRWDMDKTFRVIRKPLLNQEQ